MAVPDDRKYLSSHEWYKLEGDVVVMGITQFAADELTDVTYVSLPAVGKAVSAGKPLGEVESVKATSELMSGINGTVTAVNAALGDRPELVNTDPFGAGWMIKIKPANARDLDGLLSAAAYQKQIG